MFKIREGVEEDCIEIEEMIRQLALFENMPKEPKIDRKILMADGFGEQRLVRTFVVELEENKQLIGYSLYYYKFSTYNGKSLYLEDIYVKPNYRHLGVGRALLTAVTKEAADHRCDGMEWSCWHWNHNSIQFYEKFGAKNYSEDEGWLSFKLDKQQIESIAKTTGA